MTEIGSPPSEPGDPSEPGRLAVRAAVAIGRTAVLIAWMVGRIAVVTGRITARYARAETRPEWLNRVPGNRFALTALVMVALLALYGVASIAGPARHAPPTPVTAAVTAAIVACPDPAGAQVTAVTAPGSRAPGQARVTGVSAIPQVPGALWSTEVKKHSGPWTFAASGSLAAGLTVEQTSTQGGLAGVRCAAPATDLWFVGPGPADAEDVELSLTNVDDREVVIDLQGVSGEGSIETLDGHGTTVAGHSTRLIHVGEQPEGLGGAASGAKLIALHVQAIGGRIAAAVRVRRANGADWLPAAAPGTRLVLPGVPPGKGRRRLLIAVPGLDPATIRLQVISPDGTSAPAGLGTLSAAALAVTPADLGLGGKPAGLRIVSDKPVVAALVADDGGDFAVAGAVADLGLGGLVADDRETTTLLFTAPERAAVVHITQLTVLGPVDDARDVTVPAGRTVQLTVPPPSDAREFALSLVPRPGSGPVYAARLMRIKKAGSTLLPIPPARTTVTLPPVVDRPLP